MMDVIDIIYMYISLTLITKPLMCLNMYLHLNLIYIFIIHI